MYERFYGFRERPFSLLPDPDFLFLSDKHRTALDLLEMAIFNQSGFCVISGEIGAGKTTLIRELLNRLDDSVRAGLVSNTHRSFGELMQWVMAAYGLPCGSHDRLELHKHFINFVVENYARNQTTLLIIDEAQNLSVSAMEELRMLSNVNSDKHLVLQVVLVGQQQLRDKLRRPALEQFAQRIGIDFHLSALDEAETAQYIRHRVSHAGAAPDLFEAEACRAVHGFSQGVPRVINRICDLSLIYGYAEGSARITPQLVRSVVEDQHMSRVLNAASRQPASTSLPGVKSVVQAISAQDAAARPLVANGEAMATQANTGGAQVPGEPQAVSRRPGRLAASPTSSAAAETGSERAVAEDAASETHESAVSPAHPVTSDLHALVVNAEHNKRNAIEPPEEATVRRGIWLWIGVLVVAGAAAWSGQDAWYPWVTERFAGLSDTTQSAKVDARQASKPAAAVLPTAGKSAAADTEAERLAAQKKLEREQERLAEEAERKREQERLAEQAERKREQERLAEEAERKREQERLAEEAERKREQERLARETLRLEQQRLAKVKAETQRLERERLNAERKLAEQRKARLALEQKMRREEEKLGEVRATVRPVASNPSATAVTGQHPLASMPKTDTAAGTGVRVEGFFLKPVETPGEPVRAVETQPASVPSAQPVSRDTETAGAQSVVPDDAPPPPAKADAEAEQATRDKFLANPCNGPSARFMSTCF